MKKFTSIKDGGPGTHKKKIKGIHTTLHILNMEIE